MIIYGKHIETTETNLSEKLINLFDKQSYIEVSPPQTDLFDAICGAKTLLGRKLCTYPDGSLSFFIALVKTGEAATVINQNKEIEEIPAPQGKNYFNQSAVVNITNDTIYYTAIDRLSEADIKHFMCRALGITSPLNFINIAGEEAVEKIARYGVNGIDLELLYNQAYVDYIQEQKNNGLTTAIREFAKHLFGMNNKLIDAKYSNGLRTRFSINRTSLPKIEKKKKTEHPINYSEEALKTMATELFTDEHLGNDIRFSIRLKNGGGRLSDSSLYLTHEVKIKRDGVSYIALIEQINAHIIRFKDQIKPHIASIKE